MSKHHKEEKEFPVFTESPEALISLIIKNNIDRDWALNEVVHGGPKHKQVYSTLLLQRMYALIQAIEKQTGSNFLVQKGTKLTSHKEEVEIAVPLVLAAVEKQHREEIEALLAHAPAHEMIAFNSLLQAIEWSIAALGKSS